MRQSVGARTSFGGGWGGGSEGVGEGELHLELRRSAEAAQAQAQASALSALQAHEQAESLARALLAAQAQLAAHVFSSKPPSRRPSRAPSPTRSRHSAHSGGARSAHSGGARSGGASQVGTLSMPPPVSWGVRPEHGVPADATRIAVWLGTPHANAAGADALRMSMGLPPRVDDGKARQQPSSQYGR
ncbi:hypothetical protein T492DRAFT_993297, partial [Pavlovales sp. CCMP2436]